MHLYSRLYPTGTKVKVSPEIKNGSYPVNSLMFVSRVHGNFKENPNVTILKGIITRKGKRGKHRLDSAAIAVNIFDLEREIRGLKRNEYRGFPFVHVNTLNEMNKNVLDMDSIDFMGWGLVYHNYLANLYNDSGISSRWPQERGNLINLIGRSADLFLDNPEGALLQYSDREFRTDIVTSIRKMEASIPVSIIAHELVRAFAELKASAYLIWDNMFGTKLYDNRMLSSNYLHYRNRYTNMRKIATSLHKKMPVSLQRVAGVHSVTKYFKLWATKTDKLPDFKSAVFTRRNIKPKETTAQGGVTTQSGIITDDDLSRSRYHGYTFGGTWG